MPSSNPSSSSTTASSFFKPPTSSSTNPNIKIKSDQKLKLGELYERFLQFGIHAGYTCLALLVYGFICSSLITFFHPFNNANDAGDDEKLKNKMKIFERIDLLFPDDLEFSPYGFNIVRGMVDSEKVEAESDSSAKTEASSRSELAFNTDNDKQSYTFKYLINLLETGGPNFTDDTKKMKVTENPYKWFSVNINSRNETVIDSKSVRAQMDDPGSWKTVVIWVKEVLCCSLYFSYGRGRYFLKEFFKWLNFWMKKGTPISGPQDNMPEYTYIRNIACLLSIFILVFLILVLLVWPSFSLFVGGFKATYSKTDGVLSNEPLGEKVEILTNKCKRAVLLLVCAFPLVMIAGFNYVWQPLQLFATILLYPISYSGSELKKVFLDIVPTLMTLFVIGMIIAASYDLDKPIAIAVSVLMVFTYWLIFKSKINNLITYFGKYKTDILKFCYVDVDKAKAK